MAVATSRRRDRLVGLVVKVSASRAEDPRFEYRLRRDFSGVESQKSCLTRQLFAGFLKSQQHASVS